MNREDFEKQKKINRLVYAMLTYLIYNSSNFSSELKRILDELHECVNSDY